MLIFFFFYRQLYCQCLCLLAKLFLERKTIYFDVSPFLFYVLVESDKKNKNNQHLIGYFSKEKMSDECYNLACLMVKLRFLLLLVIVVVQMNCFLKGFTASSTSRFWSISHRFKFEMKIQLKRFKYLFYAFFSSGYELTKLEKKSGSPEKPLSSLGQMTYKSYWHSTILAKLDEYRRSQIHVTLSQLRFVVVVL